MPASKIDPRAEASRFLNEEDGGITAFSLQMFLASLVLGGLAVDVGSAIEARTQLQVAADAAAHAALYTRELNSVDTAKSAALQIASNTMPKGKYGTVLTTEDITFGRWDRDAQVFTPDPNSNSAVMVSAKRHGANGNGVGTFLLSLVGLNTWDITSPSVFETYIPTCFREGFVARERVDMQSNGGYVKGFCIHSQDHVSVSSNNAFESGVIVSMPYKSDIELPSSGFESNDGLEVALRDGSYILRIINRIDDIIKSVEFPQNDSVGIMTSTSPYYRSYITNKVSVKLNYKDDFDASTFKTGRIHEVSCKTDKMYVTFKSDAVMRNAALVTDCRVQIMAGARIEDSVIITRNQNAKSIYASSEIVIGKNDDCAKGGDVQIVTKGGVEFASKVSIYGSQIIAAGDISMTANSDGIEGASIVAGGTLDVTSNGTFGFCGGSGMDNNYTAAYFRLAR